MNERSRTDQMADDLQDTCIADFGTQWTNYTDNGGYYGSLKLFEDIVEPLVRVNEFRGLRAVEIGAGTGRICAMMLEAGAAEVTAVEPSAAAKVLRTNLAPYGDRVKVEDVPGDQISNGAFDIILSIGVLHHIPDPKPTVRAIFTALRPGGRALVWLYGREGNGLYLSILLPLRTITKRMPHSIVAAMAWALDIPLIVYIFFCKWLPLPLYRYMRGYLAKLTPDKRRLVIYDQLNPAWAKYYRRQEAEDLLKAAGFTDVKLHHRGGYSWTVVGTKP